MMGRTQAFETAAAVRAARDVFWKKGFESASLPDLERATGLNRSSIYHAFGSKRGLFDAVVLNYLNEVVRPRLAALKGADPAPGALDEYLADLGLALRLPGTLPADCGCLLMNAAGAPIGGEEGVGAVITAYHAELRTAIRRGVSAKLPLLPESESNTLADACTGLVISALALVRTGPEAATGSLEAARALLRGARG